MQISESLILSATDPSHHHWPGTERPFLEVVRGWQNFPARLQHGVVSIGNFDGVHRGHQEILARLVQVARQRRVPSVVFTFSPHPLVVLRPEAAPTPLTCFDYRARLLSRFGVDVMVICRAEPALLELGYREFFDQVIRCTLRPTFLLEGPNFYFGKNREGSPERLGELCRQNRIELEIVDPKTLEGDMISSSSIRTLLLQGHVQQANQLFGHCYELCGTVVPGDGRGRTLDRPTANLGKLSTLIPGDGVYAGLARSSQGVFPAAINIGAPLTFGQSDRRVEVHLIGFRGDLYQGRLCVQFLQRLRDPQTFENAEQLKTQLNHDVEATKRVVKMHLSGQNEVSN